MTGPWPTTGDRACLDWPGSAAPPAAGTPGAAPLAHTPSAPPRSPPSPAPPRPSSQRHRAPPPAPRRSRFPCRTARRRCESRWARRWRLMSHRGGSLSSSGRRARRAAWWRWAWCQWARAVGSGAHDGRSGGAADSAACGSCVYLDARCKQRAVAVHPRHRPHFSRLRTWQGSSLAVAALQSPCTCARLPASRPLAGAACAHSGCNCAPMLASSPALPAAASEAASLCAGTCAAAHRRQGHAVRLLEPLLVRPGVAQYALVASTPRLAV